ncbi:hypothetical protein PMIN03_009765 [Paraphaeosphaeria minitans]
MAVIEAVPYVSVQVLANGTPFPEFDDDDDAGNNTANSITKYIEVTTGEAFSIQYRTKPAFVPKHNFSVSMYVDGKYGDGHVLKQPTSFDLLASGIRSKV